ncbi:hypothetical protein BJ165DRAFT_1396027, partial [Panaeolus papilionaceus]
IYLTLLCSYCWWCTPILLYYEDLSVSFPHILSFFSSLPTTSLIRTFIPVSSSFFLPSRFPILSHTHIVSFHHSLHPFPSYPLTRSCR